MDRRENKIFKNLKHLQICSSEEKLFVHLKEMGVKRQTVMILKTPPPSFTITL